MLGELSLDEIEKVLESNVIGRIGCSGNNRIYIVPVTYVYENDSVIGHTAEGLKVELLRKNPECCFQVDEVQNISSWRSIIAWGRFEELKGEEAENALAKLVEKLGPLMPGESGQLARMGPISSSRVSTQRYNSIVYRIRLTEKTGRYER